MHTPVLPPGSKEAVFLPPTMERLWSDFARSRPSRHVRRADFFADLRQFAGAIPVAIPVARENALIDAGYIRANPKDERPHDRRERVAGDLEVSMERCIISYENIVAQWGDLPALIECKPDTILSMDHWRKARDVFGADACYTRNRIGEIVFETPLPPPAAWRLMCVLENKDNNAASETASDYVDDPRIFMGIDPDRIDAVEPCSLKQLPSLMGAGLGEGGDAQSAGTQNGSRSLLGIIPKKITKTSSNVQHYVQFSFHRV